MTKAELIRKLAKRAGVSDQEAKIFFEIFLQHTSSVLTPGQALNITGFGFFQLKKGKFKNIPPSIEEDYTGTEEGTAAKKDADTYYPSLVVYTPAETGDQDELLVFNIPEAKQTEYNTVDIYFSLSIGKPVIPLRGVKNDEYFIPPTGNELRRLLETKVEKLVAGSELVKNFTKGSEFFIINSDAYNTSQFELNWNEFAAEQPVMDLKIPENVPWDFGEDISKQIEEDSILDTDREEPSLELNPKNVTWSFGDEYHEVKVEELPVPDEIVPDTKQEKISLQPELQTETEQLKNFQRVTSLTKEFSSKKDTGDKLSWDFGPVSVENNSEAKENDIYKNYDEPVKDKNGFTEVKNKRKTYDIELSEGDQANLNSIIKEESEIPEDNKDVDEVSEFYKSTDAPVPKELETLSADKDHYSKRKSTPVFFVSAVVIILVGAALFMFIKNSKLLKKNEKPIIIEVAKSSSPAVVIDRTYDIPVTYPYSKSDTATSVYLPVNDTSKQVKTEEQNIRKTDNSSPAVSVIQGSRGDANSTNSVIKIKDNIYKEGDTYSVQISAWKSKLKAEGETAKLRNKGYASFVQQADVPGRGKWYRVKIGNFKTQAEAEKFLNR